MARTRCILINFIILYIASGYSEPHLYNNEFAVYVPSGPEAAEEVAISHGFLNLGQIGSLENFYLFRKKRAVKRSASPSEYHTSKLASDPQVTWVEQQVEKRRVKRDLTPEDNNDESSSESSIRGKRQFFPSNPFAEQFGRFFFSPHFQPKSVRSSSNRFPDPLYPRQWYLSEGSSNGFDMNVTGAWSQGYTGKGVVISILDDGIQHNHPDLAQNYDPRASIDINDNDPDPYPRDNGDNKHGTRCAGEVASVAYNDYCGVGVAYNSSIGGVRMLDGTVNDAVEARAISLNPDHIDIYSASWGPEDDGKTVDGPGPLAKRAFINGVIRGRHGKGSIFVWASGNGGRYTDNCNCDGYTNSIFTLSISSASQKGLKPWYLEQCSSTLATTYSSGTPGLDESVVTADMDGRLRAGHICTLEHTGTSASAPLAAGICALALEANPDLTWRDMQHLVIRTSRYEPLRRSDGWFVNAVGRHVNHKYGYGLMDGGAMVWLAKRWRSVPPQHVCQSIISRTDRTIPTHSGSSIEVEITTDGCAGSTGEVKYLEHVQAKVSLRFLPRGNIEIKLVSPSNTVSTLLFERPRDVLSEKFDDWPFLSVHFWGEKAAGTWKLQVTNTGKSNSAHPGILKEWQLILHGTKENPEFWRFSDSSFGGSSPTFSQFGDLIFSSSINRHVSTELSGFTNITSEQSSKPNSVVNDLPQKDHSVSYGSKLCHSECIGGCSGTGPQNCQSCRHFSYQGECVRNCFEGAFASDNKECLPCHGSCAQCIGPRQNQCTSCPSSALFVEHMGICVESCPLGFYAEKGMCLSCGNQCASCRTSNECLHCDHNLLVVNGSCRVSCPKGFYENENYTCSECNSSCETCISQSLEGCASCFSSTFMSQGRCLSQCPQGTYGDEKSRSCLPCPVGCSLCNREKSCSSCKSGWRLKSNVCVASLPCKPSEYMKEGKCSSCDKSCQNCNGPTDSNCLLCKSPSVFVKGQCLSNCPPAHFSLNGMCLQCPHGCSKCNSLTSCTECHHKFYLYGDVCVASCPDNFFNDRGKCLKCNQSCGLCWGPGNSQCFSCSKKKALLFNGSCRSKCPDGYFMANSTCFPCYHNCKTCSGIGINSCTSCRDSLTLDGGMCLGCSAGRYYESSIRACSSCHNSCLTCDGKFNSNCTSCQAPYSLHPQTSTCRPCCGSKYSEGEECCECNPTTNQCLGSGYADRRRIALGLLSKTNAEHGPNSFFSSAVWLVILICLVNVLIVTLVVIFIKQNKSVMKKQSGLDSYLYERIPLHRSSNDPDLPSSGLLSSRMGNIIGSHFSHCDLDSDSEDEHLYVKT